MEPTQDAELVGWWPLQHLFAFTARGRSFWRARGTKVAEKRKEMSLPHSPHLAQHLPAVQGNGAGGFYLLWREGLGQKAKGAASVKVLVKFLTPLRLWQPSTAKLGERGHHSCFCTIPVRSGWGCKAAGNNCRGHPPGIRPALTRVASISRGQQPPSRTCAPQASLRRSRRTWGFSVWVPVSCPWRLTETPQETLNGCRIGILHSSREVPVSMSISLLLFCPLREAWDTQTHAFHNQ